MILTLKYLCEGPPGTRWRTVENPSWQEVKRLIRSLDADANSDLALRREDSEELTIGGGRGRYVVSILRDDGTNGTLLSASLLDPEHLVEVVVGGQSSLLPEKCVVDLPTVLQVTNVFFRGEDMDGFAWD